MTPYIEEIVEVNLKEGTIADLIELTGPIDELLTIEKLEELGINNIQINEKIFKSILKSQNLNLIKKYVQNKVRTKDTEHVTLPNDMTIGVEIESVGILGESFIEQQSLYGWKCKEDISLTDNENETGCEVVSPILTGDGKKLRNQ